MTDDIGFSPDDIKEIGDKFTAIIRDASSGIVVEFAISVLDAHDLIKLYEAAIRGDRIAQARCWAEYCGIMRTVIAIINDR